MARSAEMVSPVKVEGSQNSVNVFVRSMDRVIKVGGVNGEEILSGVRSFGFHLRIRRPSESVADAQRLFHDSTIGPARAVSRFRDELREALAVGGERGETASRVMESLSFYPGMPGDTRSEKV